MTDHDHLASRAAGHDQIGRAHLVLAHGFTQNNVCWGDFGRSLSDWTSTTYVDLPGHGDSHHDDSDLDGAGRLLATFGPAVFVGYSLGGRTALHAALSAPRMVQGLVVIGATAGLRSPDERAERRAADDALAHDVLTGSLPDFIDRWLATPLFANLTEDHQCRAQRLTNRAEGLASSLQFRGVGNQRPLHDDLGSLSMPTLVVVGERDQKFRALGQELTDAIGSNSSLALVGNAGHACHLEQPQRTASIITEWLAASGFDDPPPASPE